MSVTCGYLAARRTFISWLNDRAASWLGGHDWQSSCDLRTAFTGYGISTEVDLLKQSMWFSMKLCFHRAASIERISVTLTRRASRPLTWIWSSPQTNRALKHRTIMFSKTETWATIILWLLMTKMGKKNKLLDICKAKEQNLIGMLSLPGKAPKLIAQVLKRRCTQLKKMSWNKELIKSWKGRAQWYNGNK